MKYSVVKYIAAVMLAAASSGALAQMVNGGGSSTGGTSEFPIVLGSTSIAALSTTTSLTGLSIAAGGANTLGATTLALSGNLTTNVTGSTQCLQANTSGVVSGTSAACLTSSGFPIVLGSTSIASGSTTTSLTGLSIAGAAGNTLSAATLNLAQDITAVNWTINGLQFIIGGQTLTNSTASGTVANLYVDKIGSPILAATNAGVTYSAAYTLDIEAPTAGTNVTITAGNALRLGGGINMNNNALAAVSNVVSNNANGYELLGGAASSTVATVLPNHGSVVSGLGGAANVPAVVVSNVTIQNWSSTGPVIAVIPADTASTDASLCRDTTSGAMKTGTGTLGICLGTSTRDAKQNIAPLIPGLEQVLALKPVSFNYRPRRGYPTEKIYYGFIAEDVDTVLPRLVGRDVNGKINSADYVGMIPVLVKAVQDQQKEIALLNRQVQQAVHAARRRPAIAR